MGIVTNQTERAILDAIRQVPTDQLAGVLNYVRGLSASGTVDPEVYAGTTPGGMSFEIPPDHIERFLRLLVDTLEVEQVAISFKREDGSLVEYTYQPETLEVGLSDIEPYLVDPSFLMEFEGGALYTGGGGCFSLRALLTPAQVQRLIGGVLRRECARISHG